ncbi:MAG: outer membrane protein transport protein [Candidatus Alcyoniella australis]|nr:outer membrane protein transport protein [Candidatus Alcyoniella australis]
MRRRCAIALLLLALALPCSAAAKSFDTFGLSTRAMVLGGAMTAVADDYSAVFYNPGGLAQLKTESFSAGYLWADVRMKANGRDQNYPVTKLSLVGLNIPIYDRLFFGVGIQIPDRVYSLTLFVDPSQPTWPQYNNMSSMLILMPGAALRLWRELSIGVSFAFSAWTYYDLGIPLYIPVGVGAQTPAADPTTFKGDSGTVGMGSLNAGAHWRINDSWRVGATYRSELDSHLPFDAQGQIEIPLYIDLATLGDIVGGDVQLEIEIPGLGSTSIELRDLELSGTVVAKLRLPFAAHAILRELAWPEQVSVGAAYNYGQRLMVSLDLTWKHWERMERVTYEIDVDPLVLHAKILPSTIRARVSSIAVPTIGAIGPAGVQIELPPVELDLELPVSFVNWPGPSFRNTLVPRLGFEYRFDPLPGFYKIGRLDPSIQSGYVYEPGIFNPDRGLTNYIDSDRHALSAGTRWGFGRPDPQQPDYCQVQLGVQYSYFAPIRWTKTAQYAAYHGFDELRGEGRIFATSLSIEVPF